MEAAGSAIVLDFKDKSETVKRRQALEAIEQVRTCLAQMRKDVQLIGLIQEMSAATLNGPIGLGSQHFVALAGIEATLEQIAAVLPSTSELSDRNESAC